MDLSHHRRLHGLLLRQRSSSSCLRKMERFRQFAVPLHTKSRTLPAF
jgi:hypothetical protein